MLYPLLQYKLYLLSGNEVKLLIKNYRTFHKLDEIGNEANIGIGGFTTGKQKNPVTKCYPLVGIEPRPLMNL